MFVVGTLAAISALIAGYPIYAGQAVRYSIATAILAGVAAAQTAWRAREEVTRTGKPTSVPGGDRGETPAAMRHRQRLLIRLTAREWAYLLALAASGLVAFNTFIIEATRDTSPALIGTIIGTVPIVLAVIGPLSQRKAPSARVLIGASIVVAGATLATGLGGGGWRGILLSVGALACEAAFSLLALPLLPKLGAIRVSAYASAAAVPMLAVLATFSSGAPRLPTAQEALGLAYLSTVVSAGAFLLWYSALPRLGADRAGLFAGVLPVGAVVTTAVLGIAAPSLFEIAGTALVIAGVTVGMGRSKRIPQIEREVPQALERAEGLGQDPVAEAQPLGAGRVERP